MKKKTLPRFLVPDLDPARPDATLPEEEAQHLTRVLRMRAGDEIAVFDGRGREFVGRVAAATRRRVTVTLVAPVVPAEESPVPFTLAQAVLKGDKMDHVIRDAVMLGAGRISPLVTAHVAVKAAALDAGKPSERWNRVALASAKQCGRATVPPVDEPVALSTFLAATDAPLRLLFVEPSAHLQPIPLRAFVDRPPPSSAALMVGPEGGWAAEEQEAAVGAGWVPVTLGGLTLRADAVAVAAVSVCRFLWEPRDGFSPLRGRV
jgi:16S rRNA (uracil1498-N3)-methyltransferase